MRSLGGKPSDHLHLVWPDPPPGTSSVQLSPNLLYRCDCPKHLAGEDCTLEPSMEALEERCRVALYPNIKECTTYPQV